ncbi:MAG: hypothetical protein QOG94_1362 [Solirubrobacteraceae bacterium]|nr:hypothetical protein [Solirubrobacteraceae bacterium]
MSQPAEVYRRRRAVAAAAVAALLLAIVVLLRSCGGARAGDTLSALPVVPVQQRAQLPGGGRTIFPARRVVAFYGAPQSDRLGILGIGDVDGAAKKLRRVARAYARKTRPVLPAFELISTIANAHPGDDALYRTHQPPETIDRYLAAARRTKALLVLDIQPGRGDFLSEVQRLQRWLLQPDVGLALDPEWHVGDDAVPGQTIGSVSADEVNAVSSYLSNLVGKHDLPEKLFVIHQFTQGMIVDKARVARPPGLAVTMNVDGFGNPANKISKYEAFTSEPTRFHDGFKLFYEEDTDLMSPRDVLRLGPPPDLVVYE